MGFVYDTFWQFWLRHLLSVFPTSYFELVSQTIWTTWGNFHIKANKRF